MDWLNTPVDVPISELIARKKRARMIEMLRAQLEGRLAPGVQVRLQLADLLVQAGRGEEAVPVLIGLADEFAADGFVAKAIAILKRVEKVHQGRHDVASRITALVQQQQRAARSARAEGEARRPVELGIEEFDAAPPSLPEDEPIETAVAPESAPPAVDTAPPAVDSEPPAVPSEPPEADDAAAPAADTIPEPPGDVSPAPPLPSAGVAQRIRGVFKRFLASLPNPPESAPPQLDAPAPVVTADSRDPADAPDPPVESAIPAFEPSEDTAPLILPDAGDAPPLEAAADDLEITLEPEPDVPSELSEQAYEDHLLDIVEDVLQRPAGTGGAAVERPRVVEYAHRLLAMPLFSDLSEDELLAVVRGLRVHTFGAGDVIVTEREPGQSLFILTSGRVKVCVRNPAGRNYSVAQLRSGDFFGEISSLSGRPRSATVVAAAATDILELDKPTLDGIARAHPRVCDVLEEAYIQRASSPEAAAIRAVPLNDPLSDQRAIEVLEAHFGESRWDPRMRLRLADVLVRAGKEEDAVPILVGLADDLAREGYPEKAISILKKIEQLQRRHIEEVSLAPRLHEEPDEAVAVAPATPAAVPARRSRARTNERLHAWLLDTVRDVVGRARTADQPAPAVKALQGYGPGLRASPLFAGFDEDELLAVIQGLRLLTFAPGDVIVTEGEPGQSVFILASGTVKVFVRSPEGHDVPVGALDEGSFFGEMSTLSGQPRSATVTAASACDLLEMDRATLDRIAVPHPNVRAVLEEFSRRRATDPAAAAVRRTPADPQG